jgi:hypothetical protein
VRTVICEFLLINDPYLREFLIIARVIIPVGLYKIMTNYLPDFLFFALFASTDIAASDSMFIKIRNEFFKIPLEAEQPE